MLFLLYDPSLKVILPTIKCLLGGTWILHSIPSWNRGWCLPYHSKVPLSLSFHRFSLCNGEGGPNFVFRMKSSGYFSDMILLDSTNEFYNIHSSRFLVSQNIFMLQKKWGSWMTFNKEKHTNTSFITLFQCWEPTGPFSILVYQKLMIHS